MTRYLVRTLLLLAVCALFVTASPTLAAFPNDVTLHQIKPKPPVSPLTLVRGSVTARPYAVMLDNHPMAYPQVGLNQAPLVFEALAEFGITRYMALFVPGITPELPTIGPVRSARSYFVEYAKGMQAVYVHAGGAPDALTMARTSVELLDMDALRVDAERYFRRVGDRQAPHNLFTSTRELAAFAEAQALAEVDLSEMGFLIKPDLPLVRRPVAQQLSYYFLYRESFVAWKYDRTSNSYLYFRQNRPHVDGATGQQLRFKNVVVLEVPERPIPGDPKQRIEQQVIGEGPARVFLDGRMIEATWRKGAGFAPLRIYGPGGTELTLNGGPVWIAVLPSLDHLTVEL
ncbi:DUF3048 domain-containing protein [Candidatus Chloroploca asiatica]|uniref:DUF3048 domain-containing protein n=1 Tax=Candidatus Chloroploca asiatica TaxID=1506545 RepID=A0A2H3KUV6_9CHLR|nr:DUF3048 domain-containing protein [Candidatus Chloroploca asiatica]PDV97657.1 hypothetical protein A9Q02_04175 [Candidatus Chloroploca asiatica]